MSTYRKFSEVEADYFRDHPEEIDSYISLIFEEYAKDGDTGALLSSLRVLSSNNWSLTAQNLFSYC